MVCRIHSLDDVYKWPKSGSRCQPVLLVAIVCKQPSPGYRMHENLSLLREPLGCHGCAFSRTSGFACDHLLRQDPYWRRSGCLTYLECIVREELLRLLRGAFAADRPAGRSLPFVSRH